MSNHDKLEQLAEIEGYDSVENMLEEATFDSVTCGICTNEGCDATTSCIEPDGHGMFCENCKTNTIDSCLIIAGII